MRTDRLLTPLTLALLAAGCAASPAARIGGAASDPVPASQPAPRACHARGSGLFSRPDPRCTPGAIDPSVTEANIDRTICRTGYTRTVRPPESVTEPEKRRSLEAYGDRGPLRRYEYDHLIALELGGVPNDSRNLWPEPGASPNPKDELERRLRHEVCAGRLGLRAAQQAIARDWVAEYHRYLP
jgi:hypothetical protein